MHAGKVHTEVGIAHQEPVETAGRPLATVGEHHDCLAVGGESAIERGLGRIGQLVVDDDRDAEFPGGVEDAAECRAVRITIDQAASDLPHVNLADHPRAAALQLDFELARRRVDGRVGQGQTGHHPIGIFLARRRQPDRVVLLEASDAQEHHLDDLVSLHRGDVRIDHGAVRQVGVGVDQRAAVVGGPGRRCQAEQHCEQHAGEEAERHSHTMPSRLRFSNSVSSMPISP